MALALSSGMAGPSVPGPFDDSWSSLPAASSLPGLQEDPNLPSLDQFDADDDLGLDFLFDLSSDDLMMDESDAFSSGLSSSSSDSESSSGCSSPCLSLDGSCHTLEHPTAEEDVAMEVGPAVEHHHPAVSSSRGGSQLQCEARPEAINTTITAATAITATTTSSRRGAGSAVVRGQRQGARPSSRRAKKRRTTTRTTTTAAAAAAAAVHQHMDAATAAGSISPCQHSQEGADGLEVEPAARKPSLGGHLPYKGHHDCRWPRCKSKYRWPDYLCGKHGGGRCQIDFYWPGHPPCDKYHQSKNAKGKLLCGAHCTQMDQATYGDKMRQGRP